MRIAVIIGLMLALAGCMTPREAYDKALVIHHQAQEQLGVAESALAKAEELAIKVGSAEAMAAVDKAKDAVLKCKVVVNQTENSLASIETSMQTESWAKAIFGVVLGLLGVPVAGRVMPNGGKTLLKITESPLERERIAREIQNEAAKKAG